MNNVISFHKALEKATPELVQRLDERGLLDHACKALEYARQLNAKGPPIDTAALDREMRDLFKERA
jgi:hypothetical protein